MTTLSKGTRMSSNRPHSPSFDAATLCEAFQLTAARHADSVALRTPGDPNPITWAQYAARVERIAGGLAARGVGRGHTVGLMLVNRPEFHLLDVAALHLGATPFSIYNTSSPEQIAYLFGNAGNRLVVTERQFVDVLRAAGADVEIVVLEDGLPDADHPDFEATWRAVQPDDLATLIYTSGTTGPPKGVQISHRNLMATLAGIEHVVPVREGGRLVSYLPCAHVADRTVAHYLGIVSGSSITDVADGKTVFAALADARPTSWLAVPRVWEKLKAALEAKGLTDPAVLPEAARAATRAQLGLDEADWVLSGAAPIAPETLEYLLALGLPVVEGWAMSETACGGTINPVDAMRVGTVGKPMGGVEVKLAEDGELLTRGVNIMVGYRNDPDKTAETIDADGWLHTGDVGVFDEDNYLKITDRIKEIIVMSNGKNVAPLPIENRLTQSPLVASAMAIGNNRKYITALIFPAEAELAALAKSLGVPSKNFEELCRNKKVAERFEKIVEGVNKDLSRYEQVKKFEIIPHELTADGGEITPTLKLKRRILEKKFGGLIEKMYPAGEG
ncbi:MAG: AMP-dependent synthetase/ligase [Sporichthyaceae bacterium]